VIQGGGLAVDIHTAILTNVPITQKYILLAESYGGLLLLIMFEYHDSWYWSAPILTAHNPIIIPFQHRGFVSHHVPNGLLPADQTQGQQADG
jgi:hypothetical protein